MSQDAESLAFRLLGPLEALAGDVPIIFARPQHRDLLGLFLLHPNKLLTVEQIVESMWGLAAPSTAIAQVQNMVSALRGALSRSPSPAAAIVRRRSGYLVEVDEGRIDVSVFDGHVSRARMSGDPEAATALLREALRLWRGRPLADVQAMYTAGTRVALQERRLLAVEALYDAELRLGRHADIVPELTAEVAEHPFRERLVGQLMTALYRCGRQADALREYRAIRRRLVDEHGLDPGPALRELERLMLNADPELAGPTSTGDTRVEAALPAPEFTPRPPSLPLARHRVPPPPTHFTGRDRELEAVMAAVSDQADGVVGIYGPPGVGKTALALTAAESLRDRYPDGQLFMDLGGPGSKLTGHEVVGVLLRGLGIDGGVVPDEPTERVMLLRGLLSDVRVLLVLDDATDEAQVRPALEGRWSGVIVTSRSRLSALADVTHVRLPVLPGPMSVRLLASVAPHHVAVDPDGAAGIASICGGLPLAVRLAGAKLAARPHWSASMLAARLVDEHHRLDELSLGDHAVRASLEVSYALLASPAQRALRTLGLLGRVDVEPWLAAAALAVPESTVLDLLEELVDAQLLEAGARPAGEAASARPDESAGAWPAGESAGAWPRYRLHELTRVFARERFDAVEAPGSQGGIAQRVAEAYLSVALVVEEALGCQGVHPCGRMPQPRLPGGVGSVRPDAVPVTGRRAEIARWLADRRDGLVAAIAAAYAAGLWGHCWALARAATPVFEVGGHHDEWLEVSRLALNAARKAGEPRWAAAIEAGLGTLYHYRAQWTQSRAALDRALAVWSGEPDRLPSGYARLVHAMTVRATGATGTDGGLLIALAAGVEERDPVLEVEALRCLAWIDRDAKAPDRAVARLIRALDRVADVPDDDHRLRAYVLHDLGVMRADRGEYDVARRDLETALDIFVRLQDRHWTALTLTRLGDTHQAGGDSSLAVERFQRALAVFREVHDQMWETSVLSRLGSVHSELGQYAVADGLLAGAAAVYKRLGQHVYRAYVLVSIGELREAQGDLPAALAAYREADDLLSGGRGSRWQERALSGLARVRAALCPPGQVPAGALGRTTSVE